MSVFIKDQGTWKASPAGWMKDDGVWKPLWEPGGPVAPPKPKPGEVEYLIVGTGGPGAAQNNGVNGSTADGSVRFN